MIDYKQYVGEYLTSKDYIVLTGIHNDEIRSALELRVKQAIQKRVNAAYGGALDDGGCSQTLKEIQSYVNGWNHAIPNWLGECIKEQKRQTDPEYQKYLELKEKFK